MTDQYALALLGALGVIGAAVVAAVGVILGLLWRRIAHLEIELHRLGHRMHELWWWARRIADHYYRYRREGSPDLPDPPSEEETP